MEGKLDYFYSFILLLRKKMDHSEKMRLEGRKPGLDYMKEVDIKPKSRPMEKFSSHQKSSFFREKTDAGNYGKFFLVFLSWRGLVQEWFKI